MEGFTSERQRRDNAQHGDQRPEAKVVTKRLHGFGLQGQNNKPKPTSQPLWNGLLFLTEFQLGVERPWS